ncbi:hypothetical protein LJC24_03445 [Desulfococcaceae bacterium OttesenSCG-928-F15]|nr:hypothetical protein [Desulfococcaceae bacterium OttesenSCG-928-F15]
MPTFMEYPHFLAFVGKGVNIIEKPDETGFCSHPKEARPLEVQQGLAFLFI